MVSADGAVVDNDVPRPERNSVPLDPCQPQVPGSRYKLCAFPTFFTSNFFFPSLPSADALEVLVLAGAIGASAMFTSAMVSVAVDLLLRILGRLQGVSGGGCQPKDAAWWLRAALGRV